MQIAIDGLQVPAKVRSRNLWQKLGYIYCDTGAMYRTVYLYGA